MPHSYQTITNLLLGFYWFDDGLQNLIARRGWPPLTRAQSQIVMNVIAGIDRPSDVAKQLGISRQAVHLTVQQMIAMDLIVLTRDPGDRRSKRLALSEKAAPIRRDARMAVNRLCRELERRIGRSNFRAMSDALAMDWGPVVRPR